MTPISSVARLAGLLTACALSTALWSSTAGAQTVHPLNGNMRFQIGNGLPIPFTLGPAPNGPVAPITPSAFVTTTGVATVRIKPGQFTYPGTVSKNAPVNFFNSKVFQVNTKLSIAFPKAGSTAVFVPNGRQGPNTVTWCPGQTMTVKTLSLNPLCVTPLAHPTVKGLLKYKRTGGEIGGAAQGSFGGFADVANVVSAGLGNAPCTGGVLGSINPLCQAAFAIANPAAVGAQGGTFGFTNTTPGLAPTPGRFYVTVTAAGPLSQGNIVGIDTVNPLGPGILNAATSDGGPWTAGTLTVSQTANAGAPTTFEIFKMKGSDNRSLAGGGTVSLVSGALSARTASGPNGNRGWLNMVIPIPPGVIPAMTTPGLAAAIGLIALVGAYFVRKRLS